MNISPQIGQVNYVSDYIVIAVLSTYLYLTNCPANTV